MQLSALYVYPIKSAAGVRVQQAQVEPRGLRGDRRWMVVDELGVSLTQRDVPRMALLRALPLAANGVELTVPGRAPLELAASGGAELEVEVWGDRVSARAASAVADQALSEFLERPCRLVFLPETSRRPVDLSYASAADEVSFADGFPYLVIGQASLDALNARLAHPVTMERFRPNLVIDGGAPHAEDGWRSIRVGELRFDLVKPCARCVLTTVDPASGVKGKEPLATLSGYRREGKNVLFGMNAIARGAGTLQLGQSVSVL